MIKTMDKLKLKLLDLSDTERLERHAQLEVAYSEKMDQVKLLEKALKQSQKSEAELRSQLKHIIYAHTPLELRR